LSNDTHFFFRHQEKVGGFFLENSWSSLLILFFFFQFLICLFSLIIFNLHTSNGGRSLIIQQDNLNGVEINWRSTQGRFLRSTRSPQNARLVWMFHCASSIVPHQLWSLFSILISWRWSRPFTWDTRKGINVFYLSPTSWKGEE
jgi:hypothetical protein